jgi:phosphomannomutase
MMGAEESGGYGFGMHLPERDGIYANLLVLDLVLREMARGVKTVSQMVAQFHELAGPSFYTRVDVHVERAVYAETKRRLLEGLIATPPTALAGQPVTRTQALDTKDGFKFFVDDGSWLLIRTSGTEPLVRVYTEATSAAARDSLVGAGEKLVRG